MQVIRRNFGYKLISVIIAVMLYVIANNQLNPRTMNDVYIAPEVANVPSDLVVRTAPAGFTVTISGLASSVAAFKADSHKATVDLSHAHLGTQKLTVHYSKTASGDIDTSGWPATSEVTLERKASHSWYVDVPPDTDAPPSGFIYMDPVATPSQAKVMGLAVDVNRVARVIAVVSRDGSTGSIDQSVDLVAQDEQRQTVDSVEIVPDHVKVHIGLKQAETNKSVVLSALVRGVPAPGFAVTGYVFRPAMLTLSGTQDALRSISSLTVPVTVDANARGTFTRTVPITLPPNVSLQQPTDTSVQIQVEVGPVSEPTPSAPVSGAPTPTSSPLTAAPLSNGEGAPASPPPAKP